MNLPENRPLDVVVPHELERVKRLLSQDLKIKRKAEGQPKAILLGGQPASGKTKLIRYLKANSRTDFVVINGDEYREYHPSYKQIQAYYGLEAPNKTQEFSNTLVEFIKQECLRRKLNFIIEGTMRTYNVIESTAKEACNHGFKAEAHVLAIHSDDSYLGIFQRYEGEIGFYGYGRFSPLSSHNEAYQQIPVNLQKASEQQLFDQITVYCRDETDTVKPAHSSEKGEMVNFTALFDQIRQPQLSSALYSQKWQTLHQQALQRGENNPDYLRYITDFCTQYA